MKFAITPSKARTFAEQLGRSLPALAPEDLLEVVACTCGFEDWRGLQSSNGSAVGPKLPMEVPNYLCTVSGLSTLEVDALLQQLLDGLEPFGAPLPFMDDDYEDAVLRKMLGDLLFWSGMIYSDNPLRRPLQWLSREPDGGGPFYRLANTDVFTFGIKNASTMLLKHQDREIHSLGPDVSRQLPRDVVLWLNKYAPCENAAIELMRKMAAEPREAHIETSPDAKMVRSAQWAISSVQRLGNNEYCLDCLACFDVEIFAPKDSTSVTVKIDLAAVVGVYDSDVSYEVAECIAAIVEGHYLDPLIWVMHGFPSARIDIHIGSAFLNAGGGDEEFYELLNMTSRVLYETDRVCEEWERVQAKPGFHFYRGAGVDPILFPYSDRKLPSHVSRLFPKARVRQ